MNIFNNKIFIYISTRYITYGLQFLLSLIIAAKLGPYFLGIYGMTQLILNYFSQINFGIPHSLNVFLVHNKNDKEIQDGYILNSLVIYTIINCAILICFIISENLNIIPKGEYDINRYLVYIIIIAALTYYNTVFTIVIRFKNQVKLLSLIGSIPVLLNVCVIWFFSGQELVVTLVVTQLISCLLILILAILFKAVPSFSIRQISFDIQKQLFNKGIYLFLYNSCFYFILIITRTFVSSYYSVIEFGYFSFSYTIANAVMLLIDSLNTIIFPKTIDILSSESKEAIEDALNKLRAGYIMTAHLLIYAAMFFYPFLIMLFPKYQPALFPMCVLSLAVLMNTNSFGYMTLLIAQNKEKKAALISAVSLLMAFIICELFARVFSVKFAFMPFTLLIAYMIFSFLAMYEGQKITYEKVSLTMTLHKFFSFKWVFPYVVSIGICLSGLYYFLVIPFVLFTVLNIKDLAYIKTLAIKMIKDPNIIDV